MMLPACISESDRVRITWGDGEVSEYHAIWLADNDPSHRDRRTKQRLIDVADLPADPRIVSGGLRDDCLRLLWNDRTISEFSLDWLFQHRPGATNSAPAEIRTWGQADVDILRRDSFDEVRSSPARRLKWLERIANTGVAFLSGAPLENSKVLEVAAMIGWVRETNYGRIFDVRALSDANNLAYTAQALGVHTDNPYRDPVPGLQILHCLEEAHDGGINTFVDGFRSAEILKVRAPEAFEILSSTPVRFEFSDTVTHLSAERPIIQQINGRIEAIHYNNRAIAPLRLPAATMIGFYSAYRAFALILRDSAQILTTSLRVGEVVAFDNRRILHGRTAFTSNEPRHLQGCYLEHDGLRSQIAVLQRNGLH